MDLTDLGGIVRNLTQSAEERAVGRALQLHSKGQTDKAIGVLKEAQARAPEDPGVLMELGRLQTTAGRPIEGVEAFRALLRKDPHSLPRVAEAIEELRARHAPVGPLYDAIAEHHVRTDSAAQALAVLERMRAEDLRTLMPRYVAKWEQARRTAPDARLTRTTLLPAIHLALLYEALKEHARAIAQYRNILKTNPEETARILPRLEALAARDYQNADLRLEIGGILLDAGKTADAAKHFALALEVSPRAARPAAERIALRLAGSGDDVELRWVMARALLAAADPAGALEALRPLVASGSHLDDIISMVQPLAAEEKAGAARRLLAEAFMRRGQPHQALGALLQAAEEEGLKAVEQPLLDLVQAHPDLARAWHMLADIHLEHGRTAEALAAIRRSHALAPQETAILVPRLTRLLARDGRLADAHIMLADLLAGAGEVARAVVVLRHLVREAPGEAAAATERLARLTSTVAGPRALIGLAEAALAAGRHPEALGHLEQVAAGHADLTAEFLHAVGELVAAAPALAGRVVGLLEALEPRSPLPVAVHFARGEAQFHAGLLPAAAASLREVLQSAPERVAEVRAALERFDRADPRAAEARYLLAIIYVDMRDHDAARAELMRPGPTNAALLARVVKRYESLVAETPDDMTARAALMQALLLARQLDRVLEVGRETLKRRDDASTATVALAMADALAEKGDSDGAVRRYFAASKRDPRLTGEVIARLKRLIEVEGKHPFGCLALARLLAQEGRAAEAIDALKAARAGDPVLHESVVQELEALVRAVPADPLPGLALVAMLHEAGQYQKAVQVIAVHLDAHPSSAQRLAAHLDAILEAQPGHPLAHYELGRALLALGANARAADRLATSARLDATIGPLALRRLQEILIADPACTPAWIACSEVLAARGQVLQAAERLAEAIARTPVDTDPLLNRLDELHRKHPGQTAMTLLLAEACARAGRHERAAHAYGEAAAADLALGDEALAGLDAILETNPRLPEVRLARARTRMRMLRAEPALADFAAAARLQPRLAPEVLRDVETLADQRPDWPECALLLADLLMAADRTADAEKHLEARLAGAAGGARLSMLLRLARCAAARGDADAARVHLADAARLSTDRNEYLTQAHSLHTDLLRRRASRLRAALDGDAGGRGAKGRAGATGRAGTTGGAQVLAGDLKSAVRACIDLGLPDEADALITAHGDRLLDEAERRVLRGEVALRRGDYTRAAEALRAAGPGPLLAFGALRAGDTSLAIRTLEALVARDSDPRARAALERAYRDIVAADLLGGSRRLQAETSLTFGEGAAA
jgi:tetratricopeptide (TPR) repeat protein